MAFGESYSIGWYKISGGGGASTNAQYTVTGTIGQHVAGTLSSAGYWLTGGFWSLISVVQTPGAPLLNISQLGNAVVVSWPSPTGIFAPAKHKLERHELDNEWLYDFRRWHEQERHDFPAVWKPTLPIAAILNQGAMRRLS